MVGKKTLEPGASYCLNVDGCFYSADRTELLSCPEDLESCSVMPGCVKIADNAFKGCRRLRSIELPESLEEIGSFAFSFTGISTFICPPRLKRIGKKAFYSCKSLETFLPDDALEEIGDNAFENSGLRELHLSAGCASVGRMLLRGAWLEGHHAPALLTADEGNRHFAIDEGGALYAKRGGRLVLLEMMNAAHAEHRVAAGTVRIAPNAYRGNKTITRVVLPEGLKTIGNAAFQGCTSLARVNLPDSLERIDADAFYDTGLVSLRLPAKLSVVGMCALITAHGEARGVPTLQEVEVDPENGKFYTEEGLLVERRSSGDYLVCHYGKSKVVRIPPQVKALGPYALLGCGDARQLVLHDGIESMHSSSFVSNGVIENVRIEFSEPKEGLDHVDVCFPTDTVHNAVFAQAFYQSASKWLRSSHSGRRDAGSASGGAAVAGGGWSGLGKPAGAGGGSDARLRAERALRHTRGTVEFRPGAGLVMQPGDPRFGSGPAQDMTSGLSGAAAVEKRRREWGRSGRSAHGVDGFEGALQVEQVCACADRALAGLTNDPHRFAVLALRRFATPYALAEKNRRVITGRLQSQLADAVGECSRVGDVATVRGLVDAGFVDAARIDDCLEAAQGAADITVASYLLQVKREKFEKPTFDFGI